MTFPLLQLLRHVLHVRSGAPRQQVRAGGRRHLQPRQPAGEQRAAQRRVGGGRHGLHRQHHRAAGPRADEGEQLRAFLPHQGAYRGRVTWSLTLTFLFSFTCDTVL